MSSSPIICSRTSLSPSSPSTEITNCTGKFSRQPTLSTPERLLDAYIRSYTETSLSSVTISFPFPIKNPWWIQMSSIRATIINIFYSTSPFYVRFVDIPQISYTSSLISTTAFFSPSVHQWGNFQVPSGLVESSV